MKSQVSNEGTNRLLNKAQPQILIDFLILLHTSPSLQKRELYFRMCSNTYRLFENDENCYEIGKGQPLCFLTVLTSEEQLFEKEQQSIILYYFLRLTEKGRQMGKLLIVKLVQIQHNLQSASSALLTFKSFNRHFRDIG